MSSPKEFHIDAVYPEPLSRLRRGHGGISALENSSSSSYRRAVKKQRNRGAGGSGRFRTQPVTFQEIQEVDEDNIVELESENLRGSAGAVASAAASKSESDLKASFQLFYASIKSSTDDDPTSPTSQMQLEFSTPTIKPIEPQKPLVDPLAKPTSGGVSILKKDNTSSTTQGSTTHPQSSPITISFNTRSRQSF